MVQPRGSDVTTGIIIDSDDSLDRSNTIRVDYTHTTHTHTHTRTSFLLTENHTSSAFLSPLSSYAFALSCAIQLYNYNSLNILLFIQGILRYILSNSSVRANLGEFEVKRSLACRDIQTQSCGNRLHLRVK